MYLKEAPLKNLEIAYLKIALKEITRFTRKSETCFVLCFVRNETQQHLLNNNDDNSNTNNFVLYVTIFPDTKLFKSSMLNHQLSVC